MKGITEIVSSISGNPLAFYNLYAYSLNTCTYSYFFCIFSDQEENGFDCASVVLISGSGETCKNACGIFTLQKSAIGILFMALHQTFPEEWQNFDPPALLFGQWQILPDFSVLSFAFLCP